ncbi:MAG: DUF2092 domain-containing protein [Candidatus Omnitrophota bacterium]
MAQKKRPVLCRRISGLILSGLIFMAALPFSGYCAGSGEEIVKKVAQTYKGILTYQDETLVTLYVTGEGIENKTSWRFRVVLERPNKLAITLKSGCQESGAADIISDGKNVYTYIPLLNKYTVQKTPENFAKFVEDYVINLDFVLILTLFCDDPYAELMENVEEIKVIGEESLSGIKTIHLLFIQSDGNIDLWVNAETYLIQKVRLDISRMMKAQGVLSSDEMTMIGEVVSENIRLDKRIPKEVFVFTPPEGAEKDEGSGYQDDIPILEDGGCGRV